MLKKLSKTLLLLTVGCATIVNCKSSPERNDSEEEIETMLESEGSIGVNDEVPSHYLSDVFTGKDAALVWTSEDGITFQTHLISYAKTGAKVVKTYQKLYIFAEDALWRVKRDYVPVKEGDCQTKGGVQDTKKNSLVIEPVWRQNGKGGDMSGIELTNPRDTPNAEYKIKTKIIGSYGEYIFAVVCSSYHYCYGDHEYPTCRWSGHNLRTRKPVGTDQFIASYPFKQQRNDLFSEYNGISDDLVSGSDYPLYIVPRWDARGNSSWNKYYRARKKVANRNYKEYQEIIKQQYYGSAKAEPQKPPGIGRFLVGHKYSGYSLIPWESIGKVQDILN